MKKGLLTLLTKKTMKWKKDKIVYKDDEKTKIVKGKIIKEDEFIYDIQTRDSSVITIGKRAVIQIIRKGVDDEYEG